MLKLLSRLREGQTSELQSQKKSKLAWLEIPATNLKRAMLFYENVFNIKLERRIIGNKVFAVFDEYQSGIGGCIIESEGPLTRNGIRPMFNVDVMFNSLKKIEAYGGCIVSQPDLLKQENEKGESIIGENLIDNQIGYLCEITDSEGNGLLLYSHS